MLSDSRPREELGRSERGGTADIQTADIYEAALPDGRIVTLEPGQSVKDWAKHFQNAPLVIDLGGLA